MSEFGILPTTESRHTGPARNPWDTERTPGGSSGGSAAAVAAGLVPIAHGNDGGGSLRIPAACCGLVGLKPSRGRISRGPDLGDSFLAGDGVLTRTVTETALLLDVLSGYEPGDATWAPRPAEPYTLAMRRDPGQLRIAMSLANALDVDADPEVVRGLHRTAELLRELGHEVEEASPALPSHDALDIFLHVFGPAAALGIRFGEMLAGRAAGGRRDRAALARRARHGAASCPRRATSARSPSCSCSRAATVAFFADYDILMTPVLAVPAAADRRAARVRRAAARRPAPLRPLRPLHGAVQRDRPAGHLGAGRLRRGRPADARCSSSATRSARRRCSRSPRSSRPRGPGRRTARRSPSASRRQRAAAG